MSKFGLFNLITKVSKQDKLLINEELLLDRLIQIRKFRKKKNIQNVFPTFVDIEDTHILFINSHFKPYVNICFEYYKELSDIDIDLSKKNNIYTFNINTFGDFISDMVLHIQLTNCDSLMPDENIEFINYFDKDTNYFLENKQSVSSRDSSLYKFCFS